MDLTLILLFTILLIPLQYLVKAFLKRKKFWDAIEPLGGEKWLPLIGTTWNFIKVKREDFYEAFLERNRLHGPLYRSWMGSTPVVHVMRAADVEPVLKSSVNITKGDNYKFLLPWLGEGLITGAGKKWHRHRKLITPTFHFSILDNMTEVFSEKGQILTTLLPSDGKFFNIYPLLSHCALDIICETAMGVEVNAMQCSDSEYVKAIYGITDIILYRMFRPWLHSDFIFSRSAKAVEHQKCLDILHGFTKKVIIERKEKLTSDKTAQHEQSEEDKLLGKKKRLAFLDLLLDANKKDHGGLTDEELREEVDTFMFAGHDTTTVSVAWNLFLLSNMPEIQEKVHQELDEIFHGEERPITPQDVMEMQFLDRVMKETSRMIPVIPVVARNLDSEVEIDGHTIPAGVMFVIHLAALHKDPDQFPDPERYDPDRFLPENIATRHPYSFSPFSAGPRNCLGQKFAQRNGKVLLASILRKFNVTAEKKLHEMKYSIEIVLRPQGGLNLAFELRKK